MIKFEFRKRDNNELIFSCTCEDIRKATDLFIAEVQDKSLITRENYGATTAIYSYMNVEDIIEVRLHND